MEFQRNQPIRFGPEFSDMQEVSDVEISFTSGLREQRDVDVGSGGGELVDPVEVELDGQLETAFPWNENLADKNSAEYSEKKNILEADLKSILEADDDIETVEMGDCTFTEAGGERRRRNADNTTAQASYTLSVMGSNLTAAKAAAKSTVTNANPNLFSSLNQNSANSYVQTARLAQTDTTVPAVTEGTTEDVTTPKKEATTVAKAEPVTTAKAEPAPTTEPTLTRFSSESPEFSGCPAATAATILIYTLFFL